MHHPMKQTISEDIRIPAIVADYNKNVSHMDLSDWIKINILSKGELWNGRKKRGALFRA